MVPKESAREGLIKGPKFQGWLIDSGSKKLVHNRDRSDLSANHFGLRHEHGLDESEDVLWAESRVLLCELSLLEQFQVEHTIHEAQKQVQLGDDQFKNPEDRWGQFLTQETLEEHQAGADGRPELMRNGRGVAL